jgi:hypothetical protein
MLTGNGKLLQVVSRTGVVAEVHIDDVRTVDIAPSADDATMTTIRCASRPAIYLWRAGDESEATRALLVPMAALRRVWAKRGGG